jgi:hypothetical protein
VCSPRRTRRAIARALSATRRSGGVAEEAKCRGDLKKRSQCGGPRFDPALPPVSRHAACAVCLRYSLTPRVAHLKKFRACVQRGASKSRAAVGGLADARSDDTSLLADARWFVIRETLSRAVIASAARLDRRRLTYVGACTARSRVEHIRRGSVVQRRVVIGTDLAPARSNGEKPTQFGVMHSGPQDRRRTSA